MDQSVETFVEESVWVLLGNGPKIHKELASGNWKLWILIGTVGVGGDRRKFKDKRTETNSRFQNDTILILNTELYKTIRVF